MLDIQIIIIIFIIPDSVLMTLSHEIRMTTETELIFSPERTSNNSFNVFSSKKVNQFYFSKYLFLYFLCFRQVAVG